jgi:hypothetical protein
MANDEIVTRLAGQQRLEKNEGWFVAKHSALIFVTASDSSIVISNILAYREILSIL